MNINIRVIDMRFFAVHEWMKNKGQMGLGIIDKIGGAFESFVNKSTEM